MKPIYKTIAACVIGTGTIGIADADILATLKRFERGSTIPFYFKNTPEKSTYNIRREVDSRRLPKKVRMKLGIKATKGDKIQSVKIIPRDTWESRIRPIDTRYEKPQTEINFMNITQTYRKPKDAGLEMHVKYIPKGKKHTKNLVYRLKMPVRRYRGRR